MPDITITFEDGKQHVYQNAPDTLTPADVYSRVQKDFPDQNLKAIARGAGTPAPGEGMPSARAEQPENLMGENAARDLTAEQRTAQRTGYRARLAGVGEQGPGVVGNNEGFSAPGPEGGLGQQMLGIAQGAPLSLYSGVAGLTGDILPSGAEAANAIYGPAANPAIASGRESSMMIGVPGGAEGAVLRRIDHHPIVPGHHHPG